MATTAISSGSPLGRNTSTNGMLPQRLKLHLCFTPTWRSTQLDTRMPTTMLTRLETGLTDALPASGPKIGLLVGEAPEDPSGADAPMLAGELGVGRNR